MTNKNIQDVVNEKIEEIKAEFRMFVPEDDGSAMDWLENTLTQLVKEVEAGERERCIQIAKGCCMNGNNHGNYADGAKDMNKHIITSLSKDAEQVGEIEYYYHGHKLFNIEVLENDFNFFDIEASYVSDGRIKKGKFKITELTLNYKPHPLPVT